MPKLTNKKKLNEWSVLYLGNFNARLGDFLMRETCRQDRHRDVGIASNNKGLKAKISQINFNMFFLFNPSRGWNVLEAERLLHS